MRNTVVVGAGGGIGRFLVNRMNAVPICRGDDLGAITADSTIIFCAAKAHFQTPFSDLYASLEDNFLLLERVSRLPHSRMVFFSTADVYDRDGLAHDETEDLEIENLAGGYSSFKLMCEAAVLKRCQNPLVLRPSSLFGAGMRPNNILKVLLHREQEITLSESSSFNCVTYEMIAELIETALANGTSGIINCAANDTVTLQEVAELCGYSGMFGEYKYHAPCFVNKKATELVPAYNTKSLNVVEQIYKSLEDYT